MRCTPLLLTSIPLQSPHTKHLRGAAVAALHHEDVDQRLLSHHHLDKLLELGELKVLGKEVRGVLISRYVRDVDLTHFDKLAHTIAHRSRIRSRTGDLFVFGRRIH